MFEKFLKRASWTDIVISIIFAFFGTLLIARPDEMVAAITTILGIMFIAMGVLKLLEYFTSETKEDYLLTIALIAVVFGVIVLFAPTPLMQMLKGILGLWIIATGIMDFQTTLIWKEVKSAYWTLALVFSMLMIIAGIVILVNGNIVVKTIGVITVIYSVLDIIDRIIFMNKIKDYIKK